MVSFQNNQELLDYAKSFRNLAFTTDMEFGHGFQVTESLDTVALHLSNEDGQWIEVDPFQQSIESDLLVLYSKNFSLGDDSTSGSSLLEYEFPLTLDLEEDLELWYEIVKDYIENKWEEDLESLSGWYDPAGGWHSNNEDDPAAMYE